MFVQDIIEQIVIKKKERIKVPFFVLFSTGYNCHLADTLIVFV